VAALLAERQRGHRLGAGVLSPASGRAKPKNKRTPGLSAGSAQSLRRSAFSRAEPSRRTAACAHTSGNASVPPAAAASCAAGLAWDVAASYSPALSCARNATEWSPHVGTWRPREYGGLGPRRRGFAGAGR
jgi:hypothetical protein